MEQKIPILHNASRVKEEGQLLYNNSFYNAGTQPDKNSEEKENFRTMLLMNTGK